ncbi:hypothetical protein TI39_contig4602g00001 [Zymoseptoria brevis]|uniref:NmrA-like domain-containing protein n=1 Tax=Zymoseptoria brevis TaxID=1047168 RepID=A0A0F4G6E5_9PEZI|nr:hypothetical protein TI39_contig4602g00001 [Zymoseptoria brevis]
MLVLSVLTDLRKWSGGKITWHYHFESKWRIVEYLQENYPELHGQSSFFQAAWHLSNLDTTLAPRMVSFKLFGVYKANAADYGQTPEGYIVSFTIDGNKPVPMIDARNVTGPLVKALVEAAPGKNLMGYTSEISFNEIAQILGKNLGVEVKYQRGTVKAMDKLMPGAMGMEFGETLEYLNSPGYYGGEAAIRELSLITPDDLGTFQLTEVREYLKGRTLL